MEKGKSNVRRGMTISLANINNSEAKERRRNMLNKLRLMHTSKENRQIFCQSSEHYLCPKTKTNN